jgi:hypothetical protein
MTHDMTLIGLTGRAGTGKDTAAAYLCARYGFAQASFADPIRSMVLLMLEEADIDHGWLTVRWLKEAEIPELGTSARALMQTIGTECGRMLNRDIWVNHLQRRLGLPEQPVHDRVVISDVRMFNEAAWVRRQGGTLLRLSRMQADAVRGHASEASIEHLAADHDISNDGEHFAGLYAELDGLMAQRGIEPREGYWGGLRLDPSQAVDHEGGVD